MTELKLRLNAEEYRAELEKVIAETKAAGADLSSLGGGSAQTEVKVTATGTEEVQQALAAIPEEKTVEVKSQAETAPIDRFQQKLDRLKNKKVKVVAEAKTAPVDNLNKKMDATAGKAKGLGGWLKNAFSQGLGENIGKGATAIGAVGAVAGAAVPPVGALAAVVNALISPVAIITAALAALVAIGAAVWDKMTVSAEEYAATAENMAKDAERQQQKMQELEQKTGRYVQRLRELNSLESDGNATMRETAAILDVLQQDFGDLGAIVDESTGKIKNLQEVLDRLEGRKNQKKTEADRNAVDAQMAKAKAAYMKARGADYFTTEGGAADEWDAGMTENDLIARREDDQNNADQRNGYQEALDALRKAKELQEQIEFRAKTGFDNEEQRLAAIAQKAKEAASAAALYKKTLARLDQQYFDAELSGADTERGFYSAEEEKDYDLRKTRISKEIQRLREKYRELLEKTHSANMEAAKFERGTLERTQADTRARELSLEKGEAYAALRAKQKELFDLEEQRLLAQKKMVEEAKYELEYNDLLAKGEYQKVEALKLEKELKSQNLVLSQREKDEILAARAALKEQASEKRISDAREETALQRLLVQGRYEEYQIMKMELEAKRAGRELTEKERDAVLEQVKARKSLDLTQSLQNRADSLAEKLAGQSGQGEAYAVQKALRDAERSKGFALTEDERRLTERLAKMEFSLANPGRGSIDTLKGAEIQSNDLTARGGFASGAVVPEKDRIAQAIEGHTKSIRDKMAEVVNLQNSIKQLIGT